MKWFRQPATPVKGPPPAAPSRPPPPPSMQIRLAAAAPYQPLPVTSADPVDAELVRLWAHYQATERDPSWERFVAQLNQTNVVLINAIDDARKKLGEFPPADPRRP